MFLFCITLSSCAQQVAKPYPEKSLSNEQVARLRPSKSNSIWQPAFVDFMDISRHIDEPKWKNVGNYFAGYPKRMNLKPGRYRVKFICSSGASYAYPSTIIVVEAGTIYSTRCFNAVDGLIGIEVVESNETGVKL
jgi:hypothetical protein